MNMNITYIDGFAKALRAFDSVLDDFAETTKTNRAGFQGYWDSSNAEPLEEGKHYTSSRFPENTCRSKKVRFEDILDDIQHVVYNDPATIVTFSDGSKVCVKACSKDTFNKETGLIYAIIKRLYANDVDEKTGYLRTAGLGEKIAKIVNGAIDQKEQERVRRAKRKAKAEKKANAEKEKLANEVSEQAAKEAVNQVYGESQAQ